MSILQRRHTRLLLSLLLGLVLLPGCRGAVPMKPPEDKKALEREDPLDQARDAVRHATTAADYRKALDVLNGLLAEQPETLARYQPSAEDRPALQRLLRGTPGLDVDKRDERALQEILLTRRLGLEDDEVREVRADRFSPLDAHHLEYGFLLRDAVRSLKLGERDARAESDKGGGRLGQVERGFDWVMRQVALREKPGELQPPEFALRAGRGTGRERVLIFLALLRQMGLDGCTIVCPGAKAGEEHYWLAGALVPHADRQDIYLFDPRLGVPLSGPGGKGIATLTQLRGGSEILDAKARYDVTPEQAVKAEVSLVLPLSSLSARMRWLEEEVFAAHDRVALALRPAELLERFEKAQGKPVKIWNRRARPGEASPRTPTRVLRLSLPPEEGGTDKAGQYRLHRVSLLPWPPVNQALREMKIPEDLPGEAGENRIRQWVFLLYEKYVLAPREQILRGRLEEASKQLVRLRTALDAYAAAQPDEADFVAQLARWRERAKQAFLKFRQEKAQRPLDELWSEDTYILGVLTLGEEERDQQKLRRGLPGFVTFRAAGEALRKEVVYLQALRWHEKAELRQAQLGRAVSAKGKQRLHAEADDVWNNAQERWGQYQHQSDNPATPNAVKARLLALGGAGDVNAVGELLDYFFADVRRALHARLLQAEAFAKNGKAKAARTALEGVLRQLDALDNSPDLKLLRTRLPGRLQVEHAEALVAALFADVAPDGTFAWMRRRAALELHRLSDKGE